MSKKQVFLLFLLTLTLFLLSGGAADEAVCINDCCRFGLSANRQDRQNILDGRNMTSWSAEGDAWIEVSAPENMPAGGLYIRWGGWNIPDCAVEIPDEDGSWKAFRDLSEEKYYNQYIAFGRPLTHFRIRNKPGTDTEMSVTDLKVLSTGEELPDWVEVWQPSCEKADLLIIVAHPDDELLWMGGMIPYYAGERQKKVAVCYVARMPGYRKNELLDGLWECGVRNYPEMPGDTFRDISFENRAQCLQQWDEEKLTDYIRRIICRYQPEVVVTHDEKGEYGHGAHRAVNYITEKLFDRLNSGPLRDDRSGSAQPQKLYVHLLQGELGQICFNWRQPLDAFGGRTALEVAAAAFDRHRSQNHQRYAVRDSGPYNSALFGLYYSAAGPDEKQNDLFEHIVPQK